MTDSEGLSPLAISIKFDKREVEKYLRDYGCTLNDDDNNLKQELFFKACGEQGRLDLVKHLLDDIPNCDPSSKHYVMSFEAAVLIITIL